jgi:hypothetical protein
MAADPLGAAMKKNKKYELTSADRSDGGHAHAKLVRRRKDKQVAGVAQNFARLTGLEDVKYRPALLSLARVSLLCERSYQVLKDRNSLLDADGELCKSIDVFRRLAETQSVLLKSLGLMPGSPVAESADKEIEAACVRIEALKRVHTNGKSA